MTKTYLFMWPRDGAKSLPVEQILAALGKSGLHCKEHSGKLGPELLLEGHDSPISLKTKDGMIVGAGLVFQSGVPEEEALSNSLAKALKRFGWSGMLSSVPAEEIPPSLSSGLGLRPS